MTDRYMGYKRALQINGLAEEPAWQILRAPVLQENRGSPRTSDSGTSVGVVTAADFRFGTSSGAVTAADSDSELLQEPLQQRTSDSELLRAVSSGL